MKKARARTSFFILEMLPTRTFGEHPPHFSSMFPVHPSPETASELPVPSELFFQLQSQSWF